MNFRKIVIAIDDSPIAEKVALTGFQIAQQLNAEIALVSVVDTVFLMTEGGITPKEMADSIKSDYKRNQQLLIDKFFKGVKCSTFVEEGKPYEMLLKVADEWAADLIVIGTHGRTGLSHLIMGSVAEHVVRHSKLPIIVIPTK